MLLVMDFPERLAALRKERGLTQRALSELVGIHVVQSATLRGRCLQPSLEVIRKLAKALSISADALLFEADERGPSDDLRLQFEAVAAFDPEDRKVAKAVLDGLILKHQAKRLAQGG